MSRSARLLALNCALMGVGLSSGCALEEVTVVDVEDVVVAEILLQVNRDAAAPNRLTAFLHRTVGGLGPGSHDVPGAGVVVSRDDGLSVELAPAPVDACAATTPIGGTGTCYVAATSAADRFGPGDQLQARVELPGGGVLTGASTVPGDFELLSGAAGERCLQPPATPLEVRWSPAEGAWAYVNETSVRGLADHFAPEGIEVDDPLYLLGLSVSATDTTIVFPGEFGVFNRFELDRAVSLTLQEGLPANTDADVTIAATDRNYVNWVRGGNFNPSGQVRVSSLRGDGMGLFGTVVVRAFSVAVEAGPDSPSSTIACIP